LERAVQDPDTLAELGVDPDDDLLECEDMLGIGRAAFDDDEALYAAVAERADGCLRVRSAALWSAMASTTTTT